MLAESSIQPILIINLQIDESEPKTVEIYSMSDATHQIQIYCMQNGIRDKNIIERLRNRVATCIENANEILNPVFKEKNLETNNRVHYNDNHTMGHRRVRSKLLIIDASQNSLGIQSLAFTAKTSKAMNQSHGAMQGQGHKLVRSLAEAVKARLFTTKNSNSIDLTMSKVKEVDKSEANEQLKRNHRKQSISAMGDENKGFGQHIAYFQTYNRNSVNPNDFRPVSQNNRNKIFVNPLIDNKKHENEINSHSISRSSKLNKKSSFYDIGQIADPKIDRNIYDNFRKAGYKEKFEFSSSENIDQRVFKRISVSELKNIFNKLGSDNSGHIGPRKMDLRTLSSAQLNNVEPIIAEILKRDKDAYFNFKDFCKIATGFVIID